MTPIPVASTSTPALAAPTATSAPAAPTATAVRPTATAEAFHGSRQPVTAQHNVQAPYPNLVTVRAAAHAGFDQIVFEFKGPLPGYRIQYTKPPIIADPSGQTLKVAGSAFLAARFEPAQAHDDAGKVTSDTNDLTPGLPNLVEAKQTGDFEAVLSWVLGLKQEADFTVLELQNPSRIVIEVAQPEGAFQGSRQPVVVGHNVPAPFPNLVTVRAASHPDFDRIVFEFKGAVPGYRVEYTKPPIIADPSGQTVKVAGNSFLAVRFTPAVAHDDAGKVTSDTADVKPGFLNLAEAKQTGDFEAVLSWVLGLNQEADFTVYELQSPPRVVIDVGH